MTSRPPLSTRRAILRLLVATIVAAAVALAVPGLCCPPGSCERCPRSSFIPVAHAAPAQSTTAPPVLEGTAVPLATSVRPGARARLRVRLRARQQFDAVVLTLSVRDPKGRRLGPDQMVETPALPTGRASYDFAVDMPTAPAGSTSTLEGVYPFEVTAASAGTVMWRTDGRILVIDPTRRAPLLLCLMWELDEGVHIDPDGDLVDGVIQASVDKTATRRGVVASHASQLMAFPSIRASMAISPLLMAQVQRLSRGAKRTTQTGTVPIPASSQAARDARAALARWRQAIGSGRVQLLTTPYADAPLEALVAHRATVDVRMQLQHGSTVLSEILETTPTTGMLRRNPTTATVSALGRLGISQLAFCSKALARARRVPDRPVRLAEASRTTGLVVDDELSALLVSSDPPDRGLDEFMAALAKRYLRGDALAVVSPAPELPQIEDMSLGRLYSRLATTGWVRTRTIADAARTVDPYSAPAALATPTARLSDTKRVWQAVSAAREDYVAIRAMTYDDNPIRRRVLSLFLTGESFEEPGTATVWLKATRDTAGQQFDRLRLFANPVVTLTGQRGKIALSLSNRTGYASKAILLMSGDGVAFPDGGRRRLGIRPKDNVYAARVALQGARTRGRVVARLMAGRRVLGKTVVLVRSTYIDKLASVGAIILALGALLLYLWRRRASAGSDAGASTRST